MASEKCGCEFSKTGDSPSGVLTEHGLTDDVVANAVQAARQVIEAAGLSQKLYIAALEISEIPQDVAKEAITLNCGTRQVCDRSEQVCDYYTDAQGKVWRRCYTRVVCRTVPNC